jgi:hypothetical protein
MSDIAMLGQRHGICSTIIALMTQMAVILFLVLSVEVHAQSVIQSPHCNGVIHGTVFDLSGQRAKGLNVVAWPLGVELGALLPRVATDQEGVYRFENLCPGRYAVVVEDKKAGYPYASPLFNEFLYGARIAEVKLTTNHLHGELPVYLPPRPGFMHVHVSNRETKAEILKYSVKLRVPGQRRTPEAGFEFDSMMKDHEMEVPPGRDVIFHVTAEGFREWRESAGHGKLMRAPSGADATLEVELEPLR